MLSWTLLADLAVLALAAAGGALLARRMARRPGLILATVLLRARWLYILIPLALALFTLEAVAMVRQEVASRLPLWLEYHYDTILRTWVLVLLGFLFSLALTVAFRQRHRQRWQLACAALLTVTAVSVAQQTWNQPIADQLGADVRDGVVLQTHGTSCAAATAANLLRLDGTVTSERQMAELLGTSARGTSTAQIVRGLARAGYVCQRLQVARIEDIAPPAILYVDAEIGPESHAVLLANADHGRFTILDPLSGRSQLDTGAIVKMWHGGGVACRIK